MIKINKVVYDFEFSFFRRALNSELAVRIVPL